MVLLGAGWEDEAADIIDAKPAIPPAADDEGSDFFFVLILAQSCHELQTLQTFPSASRMRPGGRLGCVSFVVLSGSREVISCARLPARGVEEVRWTLSR